MAEPVETAKAGRINHTPELFRRIENLEALIGKMAHYQGGAIPGLVREAGLKQYFPTPKEMTKHG